MSWRETNVIKMATRTSPRRCVLQRRLTTEQRSDNCGKARRSCKYDEQLDRSGIVDDSVVRANSTSSCQPRAKRSCNVHRLRRMSVQTGHPTTPYFQCRLPDEVLLNLFSFLLAKDICRLACVCKRFVKICQDSTLWEKLYKRTFGLDYILRNDEQTRGLYEKMPPGDVMKDSWREAFTSFYQSHHVVSSDSQKACEDLKYHSSLKEAITSVPENGTIIIHPGIYREELVVKKQVTIIGTGFEEKPQVTLEGSNATVLKFLPGSGASYVRNINVKYVSGDSLSCRPSCIEVGPDCSTIIHRCVVVSKAIAGSTVYVHGQTARPRVINCSITDSENVGIFINNNGQGIYESNDISNNKLAGVWVKNGANPIMRNNKVHHGRDVGFFIFDNGQGYYDGNDVFSNRIAGYEVRTGGNPTVVRCKIHHGLTGGIYVHDEGRGQFLENKIYANTFAGVWVTSRSNPTIRENEIFSGQQGGVYVFGEGRGVIERNNIHSNALAGIQIRSQSNPVVRHNKIHHGLHGGIYVHERGLGLIENNEIYSNTLAGIWVTTGSSPVMRNNRIHSGKQVGVYFYDNGNGILEDNEIFNHKYSGIQIRTSSNPVIRRNKIWGGQNGGILVYNQGHGLLEENEIFDNAMAGVWIKTESDPILRRNKIHDGQEGGICIFNGGKGLLENNDIFRNALTGVLISTSSFPVLRSNRIFEGGTSGIEITNNAGGILESNEIFNNKFSGICLASGVKPQLSKNIVYDNKEIIKSAVESGCCLYTISGNSCYPMNDFYRCNTCGRLENYAICVNCIKTCHQGHDVEFVRRDRFFCDCGAGSTRASCQVLAKDEHTQTTKHQNESRVNSRYGNDVIPREWPNFEHATKANASTQRP
ncbi:F-box only protein 11-like isoform X2 [Dendronephthya gigantea]|nr:F-box only protein 11-like isoform X2 [Dendronephthya gigantea]